MIDLRSDTVTKPAPGMRKAMHDAEVGDDVFGDDPTVNRLQAVLAERLGFEAGLFVASGTQSNLIGLMTHCQRGDEYIVGQEAHTYKYEAGGAAVLGSIQPQPLEHAADGSIPLEKIRKAVKPDDAHFARSRLLALENTIGGKILPQSYVEQACSLAREHRLATHLDGARFFNAAVESQQSEHELLKHFDSVSICLSKGLGAPVGSVLLGSKAYIEQAKRWRKMLGGGMRQAGILAAAGLYALEHHVKRLRDDHQRARQLFDGIKDLPWLQADEPMTNMVFVDIKQEQADKFQQYLAKKGVAVTGLYRLRFVTHLDIRSEQIQKTIQIIREFTANT
ncbi:low-specificity L-threonine aldolase [Permianibacter aggregans]|uniref:L-threonine aldolase n=1 Tax=Permianibacter aggregans TaxID=1510150 RepID=A0A4R6UND5_9GAMM|nr:low-specificity L-threonine aldolase [Permianibacter aggregans]QGX38319.1 low-specificity L-threonine aldolase [Permianibacter aggregans]TDQ48638.1 L-threonine aldolase [Permianibacter aggregans]